MILQILILGIDKSGSLLTMLTVKKGFLKINCTTNQTI